MKEQFNLSEKIIKPELPFVISKSGAIDVENVKEFIRLLKELAGNLPETIANVRFFYEIDKLAGEKLAE